MHGDESKAQVWHCGCRHVVLCPQWNIGTRSSTGVTLQPTHIELTAGAEIVQTNPSKCFAHWYSRNIPVRVTSLLFIVNIVIAKLCKPFRGIKVGSQTPECSMTAPIASPSAYRAYGQSLGFSLTVPVFCKADVGAESLESCLYSPPEAETLFGPSLMQ